MCVCVFWRSLCLKFFRLRDFCVDWIINWVVCWIAFIFVLFSSRKTILKSWLDTCSTPSWYLTICRASQAFFLMQSRHLLDTWWIDRESSYLLDSSSTPGGSIELLFLNHILYYSILARYLNCQRPIPWHLPWPPDTLAVEHYWRVYIYFHRDPSLISSISIDLSALVHLPNTLFFTSNLFLKVSSSFFKFFYT